MKTVMEVIDLDSEEGEQLSSNKHAGSTSASQMCEVTSSSFVVPTKSNIFGPVSNSQEGSTCTSSLNTPTGAKKSSFKNNSKKTKVVGKGPKNVMVRFPIKILPKPAYHEQLKKLEVITCKPADIIDTTKESLTEANSKNSKQKFFLLAPIPNDPNNKISNILLYKPDLPDKSVSSNVEQVASKLVCSKPTIQQQKQLERNLPEETNSEVFIVPNGRTPRKMIREQRVYLTESLNKGDEKKHVKTKDGESIIENTQVTDEEDPLYIPAEQQKMQSSLSFMESWKHPFAHPKEPDNTRNLKMSKTPSISNTPELLPTEMDTNMKDMDIFTPIVTLTESTHSEHSIVRNYSLLNKVKTKKKNSPKNVPPKKTKKDSKRVVNSDLIYRRKLIPGNIPVVTFDSCRNFFVKNSAWDYLEPVFKGFNEREYNISNHCFNYFSRLIESIRKYEPNRPLLADDDLFYTRKIEVLDKEGKLDKVYYVPPEIQNKRKIKSPYTLPPTKKCKIVLQRDEHVEDMLKTYLLKEKLDSNLCHSLSIPKKDANKPLIILNKINFNVLKLNETLCKHANIIYVKNVEDAYPEKLCKNDFIISRIENKTIRVVSPEALKHYFM